MIAQKLEYLALLEERRRRSAVNNLNDYCSFIEIPGAPLYEDDPDCEQFYPDTVTPAKHHRLLNDTLMRVEAGEIPRLIVLMPPGSAKSTYSTVTFPTWAMGRKPGRNIICTSYGSDLAVKFGRKCRQIARSSQYQQLFKSGLVADNKAAHDWSITNGSTYMAAGILGGVTGNRADGLIIDDPIKGREESDSKTIRDKVWEEYRSSLLTRLKPGGFVVIIQTRWHEDDLSGRILPKTWRGESGWIESQDGERWYVLCLPAQCELENDPLGRAIGEWLWTEWFTPSHWASMKRVQGSRNWSSLYQQRPQPEDGGIFKRGWPQRYREPPAEPIMIVQSLDTAYKPAQVNDPSVISTFAVTRHGYYLLEVWRDRVDFPSLKRTAKNLAAKWKPHAVLIEDKASGQSLIQELRQGGGIPVIAIEPDGDKLSRANAVSARVEAGQLYLPEDAIWLVDFESEFFNFPLATHDDQVDSVTQFLRWVHSKVVDLYAHGSGPGYAAALLERGESQLDENRGFGTVRSSTDTSGF